MKLWLKMCKILKNGGREKGKGEKIREL